jgi:hypothetical protein
MKKLFLDELNKIDLITRRAIATVSKHADKKLLNSIDPKALPKNFKIVVANSKEAL